MFKSGNITSSEYDFGVLLIERAVYFSSRYDQYEVIKKITQNVKQYTRMDEFPSMVDKIRFKNHGGDFTQWFTVNYN